MKNEIIKASDFGLEAKRGTEIESGLSVSIAERKLLSKEFESVSVLEVNEENQPKFKALRLKIVKNRTQGADVWHKKGKEVSLRLGQFYDAIKKRENQIIQSMETVLMDAEKHFENLEKKRIEDLEASRVELLTPYYADAKMLGLGTMELDVFDSYLTTKKKAFEEAVEDEKKLEAERVAKEKAEKAEQERIRLENIKLQEAAAETERLAKIEADKRAKLEAERIAKEQKAERLRKVESDRIQSENEAKLKTEREETERLAKELQAKKDAEAAAEELKLAAIEADLNKGDAAKVIDLIADLEGIKTDRKFKSKKNQKMYADACGLVDKIVTFVN